MSRLASRQTVRFGLSLSASFLLGLCAAGAGPFATGCQSQMTGVQGCQTQADCPSGLICQSDGTCVAPPKTTPVRIVKTGEGSGVITSEPAGLTCGDTCMGNFVVGKQVALTAVPAAGSEFAGYSIGCYSTTPFCTFTPEEQIESTDEVQILVNFALASTAIGPPLCNSAGSCWNNPRPAGNPLRDAVASGPGELWAVGGAGTIVRRSGGTFSLLPSGTTRDLNAISGQGTDLFMVGAGGTILRSAGASVVAETSGVSTDLYDVWSSGTTAFAVGAGGTILRRTGTAWTKETLPGNPTYDFRGVFATSASDVWAVGAGGNIARWNGTAWTIATNATVGTTELRAVTGLGADVYVVNVGGQIYRFSGGTWYQAYNGTLKTISNLTTLGSEVLAAGSDANAGSILRGSGTTWARDAYNDQAMFYGVAAVAQNEIYAVGAGGVVWTYDGTSWRALSNGRLDSLAAVAAADASNVWVAGAGGLVMRYVPGTGSYFKSETLLTGGRILGAWANSASDVWIVGVGGFTGHFDGNRWTSVASGTGANLRAVWGAASDAVYAVGDGGTILFWDGGKWNTSFSPTSAVLSGVSGTGKTDIWAVGENATVLRSSGGAFAAATPAVTGLTGSVSSVLAVSTSEAFISAGTDVWRLSGGTWTKSTPSAGVTVRALGGSGSEPWALLTGGGAARFQGGTWQAQVLGTSVDLNAVVSRGGKVWLVGESGAILSR